MAGDRECCAIAAAAPATGTFRQALYAALAINAGMFVVEMAAGIWGKSAALQADAVDFLGDAATYAITLMVLGMSIRWRAGSAVLKGLSMGGFGLWVIGVSAYHLLAGDFPSAAVMGSTGFLALAANLTSAFLLYRHRHGDSNMRSVWLCTRNDAIANVAVIAAGGGVWISATAWPDLAVGIGIACLALTSAIAVLGQASSELRAANR
jgi:Co/Zn/Cd efflux system component